MTGIDILRWMDRGYELRRFFDKSGNAVAIAGEKCSRCADALLRKKWIVEQPRNLFRLTVAGRAALAEARGRDGIRRAA